MKYIKNLSQLTLHDAPIVGSKNATLGELTHAFDGASGICVPQGFAVIVQAYWDHILHNDLYDIIQSQLARIDTQENLFLHIQHVSHVIRYAIEHAPLMPDLYQEIKHAYAALSASYNTEDLVVVVRSSATAEDLPNASFAGQQDSFLNISGIDNVIEAYKGCLASLFTERAILYRTEKGFDHLTIAMSVGIQYMVRAEQGSAGVIFTLEPESGCNDVVVINAAPGLGQALVQGSITPDEYHLFKPFVLDSAKNPIIKRLLRPHANAFCLRDDEITLLAQLATQIERYYQKIVGSSIAVDIEWAQDGITRQLYIVQVRPETIHSSTTISDITQVIYSVKPLENNIVIASGHSIGQKAAIGKIKCIPYFTHGQVIEEHDIIVTSMTDPDWVPLLKKAAGVITEQGGRTCHAAIVSRELGIPAIVGAQNALNILHTGQTVTIDCTQGMQGFVYDGVCSIEKRKQEYGLDYEKLPCKVGLIIADPDQAYIHARLPVDEVGLVRLEFVIAHHIKAHPMALLFPEKVKQEDRELLAKITAGYKDGQEFFVRKLAEGIGTIAAAFYPRPVLVRFSDFKSNEYRNLLGGSYWEPLEENPMLGLRGASRYYHASYAPAFVLECKAINYVRDVMGLINVNVMVPFVRTVEEGTKVKEILNAQGLTSGKDGLQIFMMCELPSNVILLELFAHVFDGFSIGSNDLTQTVLAVDRDSGLLTTLFREDNPAVMYMIKEAITKAHTAGKKIGICGQGPSDNRVFAQYLIDHGIDSISLNADSVMSFIQSNQVIQKERQRSHLAL